MGQDTRTIPLQGRLSVAPTSYHRLAGKKKMNSPLLNLLIVQRKQKKELSNIKSSLSTYILDQVSGYPKQELDNVEIICYDSKIYVPQSLCRRVLDWYQLYLNHPGVNGLAKTIQEVCYWKFLVTHVDLFSKMCKTCQQFKKRETLYGHLPPKNIAELKPWDSLHVLHIV